MLRRLANPLTAVAAAAVALGMAEALARALGLAPGVHPIDVTGNRSVFQRSADPILGFELKRGYRNQDPDFVVTYERTNAHGQRDRERSLAKPPGTRRVLLLGDSVVEGSGLRDLDDTLSRWMERLSGDPRLEVLNFGVSGYCTLAEVRLLELKGLAFSPDVVVVVFVENDFDNFNRQLFQLDAARPRPAWVKPLFLGSHLFRTAALAFDWFGLAADADPMARNQAAIGDDNVARGLARLRELALAHGFAPALAVWPRFADADVEDAHPVPGGGGALVVERLAAAQGIPALRLSEAFRRDRARRPEAAGPRLLYTNGDGMHPSPEGARVAARALLAALPELEARARAGLARPPTAPDEEALRLARQSGERTPNYAIVYNNVGNKLAQEGRFEPAADYYRRALDLDPRHAKSHNNLGNALASLGREDEAIESYRTALALDPAYADARYNLAAALRARGRTDEALEQLAEALRLRPGWPEAEALRSELLRERAPLSAAGSAPRR
jgi:tetratricopeptide (TPR) repeat protein